MPEPVVNLQEAQDTLDGARSQEEHVQWGRKKLETKKICEIK